MHSRKFENSLTIVNAQRTKLCHDIIFFLHCWLSSVDVVVRFSNGIYITFNIRSILILLIKFVANEKTTRYFHKLICHLTLCVFATVFEMMVGKNVVFAATLMLIYA